MAYGFYPCCGNHSRNHHKPGCPNKTADKQIEVEVVKPLAPPYFNKDRFLVLDVNHPLAMKALRELLNRK